MELFSPQEMLFGAILIVLPDWAWLGRNRPRGRGGMSKWSPSFPRRYVVIVNGSPKMIVVLPGDKTATKIRTGRGSK